MVRKQIWVAVAALPLLLLLGVVLYLSSLDFNHYKPMITAKVEALTGRELTILGDIELQLSTSPTLSVEQVQFANADWGLRREMVTIQRMVAEVDLWSLFGETPEVVHLLLEQPDILLERSSEGAVNWQMGAVVDTPPESSAEGGGIPNFKRAEIRDARLTYIDGERGRKEVIVVKQLQTSATHLGAPLQLKMAGHYNSDPFDVALKLDSLKTVEVGEPASLQLEVVLEPLKMQLNTQLLLDRKQSRYQMSEIDLQLAQSRLQGELSVDLSQDKPRLQGTLKAPQIDLIALAAVVPEEVQSTTQEPIEAAVDGQPQTELHPEKIFSSKLIDLMGLNAVDAEIELQIERLVSPYAVLESLKAKATLDNAHLEIAPLQFDVGGGHVESRLSLNGTGPVALEVALQGKQISLGQMLADAGKADQLQGMVTDIDIALQGKGYTPTTLMADLGGKVLLQSGEGKVDNQYLNLTGGDLLSQLIASLNPAAKSDPHTLLQCAVVNLKINQGVCKFDKNIAIETDKMVVVGSGEFDLGGETLTILLLVEFLLGGGSVRNSVSLD